MRVSNLPKSTQPVNSRARCHSRVSEFGNGNFDMYVEHGIGEGNSTLRYDKIL